MSLPVKKNNLQIRKKCKRVRQTLFTAFLQERCLHELEQKEIEKAHGHLYVDRTKRLETRLQKVNLYLTEIIHRCLREDKLIPALRLVYYSVKWKS